jgi:hypothetical protein
MQELSRHYKELCNCSMQLYRRKAQMINPKKVKHPMDAGACIVDVASGLRKKPIVSLRTCSSSGSKVLEPYRDG